MVFFPCKVVCSTGDVNNYVNFNTLCKVLLWISAFRTPELSHHYFEGLFTQYRAYSIVAALDCKPDEMVSKN